MSFLFSQLPIHVFSVMHVSLSYRNYFHVCAITSDVIQTLPT
jgi:hypothetical protein